MLDGQTCPYSGRRSSRLISASPKSVLKTYLTFVAGLQTEAVLTVTAALLLLLVAHVTTGVLERGAPAETKRFWRLTVRHVATAGFVLALFLIWRKELETLLLALGAATAGFLVAFREAWLSLAAAWLRMVKRPYGVHDFIEIDGLRGRVIDISWLTTTLAETNASNEGQFYSGRVLHVPNNRMLLSTVMVDNLTGDFSAHTFSVNLPYGANVLQAENLLLHAAELHCSPFYEEAERHMSELRDDEALDTPTVAPRSRIHLGKDGFNSILLRIVVPFKERSRVEQSIIRHYLMSAPDAPKRLTTLL